MSIFSTALNARTSWALHRIAQLAGDERRCQAELHRSVRYAKQAGTEAGTGADEMSCPALLADVRLLREAFIETFASVRERRLKLRTRVGIDAEMEVMAESARRGCGQIYELFADRFSSEVDDLLAELEPEFHAVALEIATNKGYETPEQRDAAAEQYAKDGSCSLTGIDPYCCPCGRHE